MNSLCHKYLNQNILPFVGREHELALLRRQFEEFAGEGESRYTLVSGEIGIGKSRLVKEFEDFLDARFKDVSVVVRARYLEGNAAALTPIINAFSAALGQHENISRLLQTLGVLPEGTIGSFHNQSEPPPLQLLIDCFREIAKRFPLILILEDIHNVDDFHSFDQFFLGLGSVAKYVIFSHRIGEKGSTVDRAAEQFVREIALREERIAEVLTMPPLGEQEILKLFHMLFVFEPSSELLRSVEDGSRGKPLNLRTMLRQLITSGIINYDEGKWWEESQPQAESTPLVEQAEESGFARFQRELERLNHDEQTFVMHAAWLGEQFDIRLLRRVMSMRLGEENLTEEIFLRVINLLTFKSIIRKATPSIYFTPRDTTGNSTVADLAAHDANCYEFSHPHFWNTVVATTRQHVAGDHQLILSIAAIAYDEQLALYSSSFLSLSGLPFVLTKSDEIRKKVESFLCWASAVARGLWAVEPQQALRFLGAVKPLRDEVTWRFSPEITEEAVQGLLDLHTMLIEALMRMGNLLEAERDLEHAAVLEKFIASRASTGEFSQEFQGLAKAKVTCLRAVVAMSRSAVPEFERWSETARQALTILPESDIERARLLTMLTRTKAEWLLSTGRLREGDELIQSGLVTASILADARFDEYCLFYRLAVTSKLKQDQNTQAAELTSEIFRRAKERRDALVETTFLFQAALAAFSTGDLKTAVRYLDQGVVQGKRYGIRFVEMMSYLWRMIIAGVQGGGDQVKDCSSQLESILTQTPNLLWRISLNEGRATTMNYLGRYTPAIEFAEMAIRLAEANHYPSFAAWAHNEKGLALIGLGKFSEAIEVAQTCLNISGEQVMHERMARTVLASAWIGLGELDRAREELERTRPLFREANPYYLRFLQAEAQLLKRELASLDVRQKGGRDREQLQAEKRKLRERLERKISEIYQLTKAWDANALSERILDEFKEVLGPGIFKPGAIEQRELAPSQSQSPSEAPAPIIRLLTFGPMTVLPLNEQAVRPADEEEDRPATTRSRDSKVRQLISMLIAARLDKLTVSKEALSDMLWPESDATNAFASLHTAVRRARTLLGHSDAITYDSGAYQLSPIVSLDVEEVIRHFEEAKLAQKRTANFAVAHHYELLIQLTERGQFLDGIYGLWLEGARSRISSIRRSAAMRLIHMDLERGLLDKAERIAHILLNEDEFDEEAIRTLLIVSARKRQMTKAVGLYDTFARKLKAEFKVDPSPELRSVFERLKSGQSV